MTALMEVEVVARKRSNLVFLWELEKASQKK